MRERLSWKKLSVLSFLGIVCKKKENPFLEALYTNWELAAFIMSISKIHSSRLSIIKSWNRGFEIEDLTIRKLNDLAVSPDDEHANLFKTLAQESSFDKILLL